jgi:hypothetical protein
MFACVLTTTTFLAGFFLRISIALKSIPPATEKCQIYSPSYTYVQYKRRVAYPPPSSIVDQRSLLLTFNAFWIGSDTVQFIKVSAKLVPGC